MTESGRQVTSNVLENKYASGSEIRGKTEGNIKYEAKGSGHFLSRCMLRQGRFVLITSGDGGGHCFVVNKIS